MEHVEGLAEAFKKAKVVFLTSFSGSKENSRPMTNYNEDPYSTMWFPTEKDTQKVKDVKSNPRVLLTFPAEKKGEYYEVTGETSFASQSEVDSKWEWWWLYWHPAQRQRFWFPKSQTDDRRVILNVKPVSARKVARG